jgi:hypothetical protein
MIWTRELGKNGGIHTHVLVHVPPPLSQDGTFQRTLEHSLEPEGGPRHDKAILIQTAYAPLGKLCYNLKGIGPKHANEFGIRPAYQGELSGKRAGLTENLGAGARRKAATATREVGQPSSCTSKKSLQTWTVSANSEPAAARGQTLASKFSSRDAHEASPARDRGGDAKPPNNEKNGELGAGPSVRQPLF